jgi:hypothetical protein
VHCNSQSPDDRRAEIRCRLRVRYEIRLERVPLAAASLIASRQRIPVRWPSGASLREAPPYPQPGSGCWGESHYAFLRSVCSATAARSPAPGEGARGLPAHTALSRPRLGNQTCYPRRSYCPTGYTRTTKSRRPKQLVSLHCHHSVDRSTQSQEVDLNTRSLAPPQWMQLGGAAPACTDRNTDPWAVGT